MRFTAAIVLAGAASAAVAATTSAAAAAATDSSVCAQNIVDACVEQFDKQIKGCGGNDYICLCDNYSNKLTCYNNCMGSQDRPPVQNQVTQFCLAAEPQRSASSASIASVLKTAGTATATATSASTTADSSSATESTAAASGFESSKTGAAVPMDIPVGGVMAVVLGLAGLL